MVVSKFIPEVLKTLTMEAVHLICVPLTYPKLLTMLITMRCLQKLMKRLILNELLSILECWLSDAIRVLNGMTHGHACLLLVLESGKVLFCPRFFSQYTWTISPDLLS